MGAQAEVTAVLRAARVAGDGWRSVPEILALLPSCVSRRENTVYAVVRRMLAYGLLDFRFRSARCREVRLKAYKFQAVPKKSGFADSPKLTTMKKGGHTRT